MTALSTSGRGLTLLATAIEEDDPEGRAAAFAILDDGDELSARAAAAIEEASAFCGDEIAIDDDNDGGPAGD